MRKDEPTAAPQVVTIVGQQRKADSLKNAIICVIAAIAITIALAIVNAGG